MAPLPHVPPHAARPGYEANVHVHVDNEKAQEYL